MGVNDFLNLPENSKCKAFLTINTSRDRCSSASNSGAGCGALGLVGASATDGCKTSSVNIKNDINDLYDCQQKLFQNTVVETIGKLSDGENDLFQILQDLSKIFSYEINIAKETLEEELKLLEATSALILFIFLIIMLFLLYIKNYR
tara:strand:- start:1564 stop:2004 length:441 start_codon:yes stop_codon:yes gene_type:complete